MASLGMPGSTTEAEGSAEGVSQSPPTFWSRACTAAATRPLRAVTCTVRLVCGLPVRVESRTGTLERGGTWMPSPTSESRAPSLPYSSMSTTAAASSGLVRWR